MEPTFIQWLIGQAGIAGLAGFALYMLDRAHKQVQLLTAEYAATNREDKLLLLRTMDEASKMQATLLTKYDTLMAFVTKREEHK